MGKFDRLLLYIGAPKTGTTSNQVAVWANRRPLMRHGVYVPLAGQRGVQHMDLPATVPNRLRGGGLDRHADLNAGNLAERRASFLTELHRELAEAPAGCHTILMMSEYLFGATRRDIDAIREVFSPHARRLEFLLYLRRQDQWLASMTLQARKAGSRQDIGLTPGPPGQFGANVRVWHAAADAAHIRRFDPSYFTDGDLFTDFRATLGLEKSAFPREKPSANPSILQEQLELIDVLNRKLEVLPFHERIPIRRLFVGFCEETVGGTRIEFTREAATRAFYSYNGVNQWLRETLDPQGPPLFFPEDFSRYPSEAPNDRRYEGEQLIRLAETLDEGAAARGLPTGGWRPGDPRETVVEAIADAFIRMRRSVLSEKRSRRLDGVSASEKRRRRRERRGGKLAAALVAKVPEETAAGEAGATS